MLQQPIVQLLGLVRCLCRVVPCKQGCTDLGRHITCKFGVVVQEVDVNETGGKSFLDKKDKGLQMTYGMIQLLNDKKKSEICPLTFPNPYTE